ncbi:hypothetical protein ASF00_13820 [Sphingomonas sp. Leaf34]|uniref:hypothetical protein n=1 Tax=Sphingomonas sp. Leaf34 TaxID=1736216 RepID=UPI000701ECC9|nr:hypothetical protein [Sphingomonas sp. Leaf34]KQN27385.1 hypothetical protein ASF00_13820 [Sphingomonas sp. Leaf34]
MADVADMANDVAQAALERSIRAARVPIPTGVPGECRECGDDSPRLVMGRCARCREPKKGYAR